MLTVVETVTATVVTGKAVVLPPAGIVTLKGTVAAVVLLLMRVTTAPPVGAGPLSMTVPVEGDPPLTLLGFSLSKVRVGGVTVRVAF